jgi:predicted MPP superfamily phosphohydrolase
MRPQRKSRLLRISICAAAPIALVAVGIAALFVGGVSSRQVPPPVYAPEPVVPGPTFTIAVLPDTQFYAEKYHDIGRSQAPWLVDHAEQLNLVGVVHVGDLTQNNTAGEYRRAREFLAPLDGVVPVWLVPGNHDIADGRDTSRYNHYFNESRYRGQPGFGGHYGGGYDNSYHFFTAAGMKFMVLCLEFGPRDQVLDWANGMIDRHPDRRVIVVTHSHVRLGRGETRGSLDRGGPGEYDFGPYNDGKQVWDKLIGKHEQVFLVLSGHFHGTALVTMRGDAGNLVHQVLANYQFEENGGNGYLRLMKFVPALDRIEVTTVSPWLGKWRRDADNEFILPYEMEASP